MLLDASVAVRLQNSLIVAEIVEVAGLDCQVGSDEVFLKKSTSKVNRVEAIPADVLHVFLDYFLLFPAVIRQRLLTDS